MQLSRITNPSILSQIPGKQTRVPTENIELLALCKWIRQEYPDKIFCCDQIGQKFSKQQAARLSQMRSNKYPDLFIAEPVKGYHGIYIEFKATGVKVQNKNGKWINEHIEGQAFVLMALKRKGYYAGFGLGIEHTKKVLKNLFE